MRTSKEKSGFSLIEVVAAIAIAGIAFAVLTQSFVNILKTLDSLEIKSDKEKQVRFVRSTIISIADRDEFEQGETISTLDFGEAEWIGFVEETNVIDLFKVRIEIEFENPDGDPFEWVETLYLLRPTWSDLAERSALLSEIKDDIAQDNSRRDW